VDLPPEEAQELIAVFREVDIDPIFLIAPTSDETRIRLICEVASGFVYYVSLKGVTGASTLDVASVQQKLFEIRKYAKVPIGVGFGIKDAASAAAVAQVADAVVVGSALVRRIEANAERVEAIAGEVSSLLNSMREAMDKNMGYKKASI
jgi:tryptophan synthase alpha chain